MKPSVQSMLTTGIAVILLGTTGFAVSHVFAQNRDDPSLAIPPSPSTAGSTTVGTPLPTVAVPGKVAATTSAPYGYSRGRHKVQTPARPAATPAPAAASKVRTASLETPSQEPSVSGLSQPDAARTGAANAPARKNGITQAGHIDALHDPNIDPSLAPPPDGLLHGPLWNRQNNGPGAAMTFPMDRGVPPTIRGSHLGLLPGETATERSLRLMSAVAELERQLEGLGQRNAELNELVRQRDDQLLLAIREIKSARKEVLGARDELERLREQVKNLHEKMLTAERDNAALLQTMAPLLYQLLDANPAAPAKTEE